MIWYILLGIGIAGLGAIGILQQWAIARVWMLRQDLFEIRDRLWDAAADKGFLEDTEYQEARASINAVIRISPMMCLPVWQELVRGNGTRPPKKPTRIPDIEIALQATSRRLAYYVLFQTVGGYLYVIRQAATKVRSQRQGIQRQVRIANSATRRIVASPTIRRLEHEYADMETCTA